MSCQIQQSLNVILGQKQNITYTKEQWKIEKQTYRLNNKILSMVVHAGYGGGDIAKKKNT